MKHACASTLLAVCAATALPALVRAQNALPPVRALSNAGAKDLADGKKIFDAQCAWCHGAEGTGGTGPNLQRPTLRNAANDAALANLVRYGIPATEMPSFAIALTDHMAWQTAAYVKSLGRTKAKPLPGDSARGSTLYASSGCASCHIVSGSGGALGPELTRIGTLRGPSYLRDALVKPAATHPPGYLVVRATRTDGTVIRGVRVNEDVFYILIRDAGGVVHSLEKAGLTKVDRELEASLMPSYTARMSDAQLDDVVAYLSGLRGEK